MEMSILRQSEQSSNSSQEVSQSVGRGFRGQPDHTVFHLSSKSTFRLSVEFFARQHVLLPLLPTHDFASKLMVFAKAFPDTQASGVNRYFSCLNPGGQGTAYKRAFSRYVPTVRFFRTISTTQNQNFWDRTVNGACHGRAAFCNERI